MFTLNLGKLYSGYYMPPIVLKLFLILTFNQFEKKAQEVRNKGIKRYREGFSRQKNIDIFQHPFTSSVED